MIDTELKEISRCIETEIGKLPIEIFSVRRGGNNQIFKASFNGHCSILIKKYFLADSKQDFPRATTEFTAFKFLWDNGLEKVPQPLFINLADRMSAYQFIDGKPVDTNSIDRNIIEQFTDFIGELKLLSSTKSALNLRPSSDCCLSLSDYWQSIEKRYQQMHRQMPKQKHYQPIIDFLEGEFRDVWQKEEKNFLSQIDLLGLEFRQPLDRKEQILSPSDFGFHNCLQQEDGRIKFIDFEYFGWDDQAKMLTDFLFHPAMQLKEEIKQEFLRRSLTAIKASKRLLERLKIVIAPVGLKWCLLLLNICSPQILQRKMFANPSLREEGFIASQLEKARKKLAQVKRGEILETVSTSL